ncbi:MAG: aminotransferase class V-fold PLP-dependent enzyme [Planctomycetota bacterium]
MSELIYLDHNATTPLAPEIAREMEPFGGSRFGNPSSPHRLGREAAEAMAVARDRVASALGCVSKEIVFTSGGTEADNAALIGAWLARPERPHVVVTVVEHPAILETADWLETRGARITRLAVDGEGRLDLAELRAAVTDATSIVSIMHVNNETGVRFPIAEAAEIAREKGALFHTDAVQSIGRLDPEELAGADLVTISGHKLHGPKGVGALKVRTGTPWLPTVFGGGQQRGRRSGTENVPGVVGLGVACERAERLRPDVAPRLTSLRDRLERRITSELTGVFVHGAGAPRAPHTSNLGFEEIEAEALLILLDDAGICASSGSACASGAAKPSHVLRAMNLPFAQLHGSIRFSLGAETTEAEIDRAAQVVIEKVRKLRALSPFSDPIER